MIYETLQMTFQGLTRTRVSSMHVLSISNLREVS